MKRRGLDWGVNDDGHKVEAAEGGVGLREYEGRLPVSRLTNVSHGILFVSGMLLGAPVTRGRLFMLGRWLVLNLKRFYFRTNFLFDFRLVFRFFPGFPKQVSQLYQSAFLLFGAMLGFLDTLLDVRKAIARLV